jgi:histidinol-phosphatase (PHP family)
LTSLINYHNHTSLCGHAEGTLDDFIEEAIKQNFSEIGFSDHAPMPHPFQEGITMLPNELEPYIDSILEKQIQYKDKITVKLGLEIDYPIYETLDKKYLNDERFDYLIGSCHIIDNWTFDHPDTVDGFEKSDINKIYSKYYALVEDCVDSGFFQIIGHFDLIKKFGYRPTTSFKETYTRIAKKMSQKNIAFEVNTSGLLKPVKEIYPAEELVKIFFENNVAVTMGSDTHYVENFGYGYSEAIAMLRRTGYRSIRGFNKKKEYSISL